MFIFMLFFFCFEGYGDHRDLPVLTPLSRHDALPILPEEAAHMGLSRLLLLSTPRQVELAERASALLGAEAVAQFNQATMHTPVDVTESAMEIVTTQQIDRKSTRLNSSH